MNPLFFVDRLATSLLLRSDRGHRGHHLAPFVAPILCVSAVIAAVPALGEEVAFRAVSYPEAIAPIADGVTPFDQWARELASDGSRLIVGARSPLYGIGLSFSTGVAEIWEHDDAVATRGWRRVADLASPNGVVSNDHFGAAVAIEGDLAVVGAPRRAVGGTVLAGVVYLYRRGSDGSWLHAQTLLSTTVATSEFFGSAVAIDNGVLVVGAPGRAGGGGATLFVPEPDGTYGAGVPFAVPGSVSSGDWGEVVAIDGDLVLVGDTESAVGAVSGVGALASFVRDGEGSPDFEGFVTPPPSDIASGVRFGIYLDCDDGLLVASSPSFNTGKGAVYCFRRTDAGWTLGPKIVGESNNARLGRVAVNNGLLAVGSNWDALSTPPARSSLYRVDANELVHLATVTQTAQGSGLGSAVALLDEWWLFREKATSGLEDAPRLLAQRLGDVGGDCDGDGIPNAVEVTAGGAADCDDDLVPSGCERADADCDADDVPDACQVAPVITQSTNNPEVGTAFFNGATPLAIYLSRIDTPLDATQLLAIGGETYTQLGTANVRSYAAIYVDLSAQPPDAAPPTNLTLLGAWETRFPSASEPFEIATDPIPLVPDGIYYIAFAIEPANLTIAPRFRARGNPYVPGYSFIGEVPNAVFDPVSIGESVLFREIDEVTGVALNFRTFARFATLADADLDGLPDTCACPGDLDGDGAVGPADLSILLGAWGGSAGDLNDDGTTDPSDIALLLGAWGPCTSG